MARANVPIKFTPEFENEQIRTFLAEVDFPPSASPDVVHGKFVGVSTDLIVQLELGLRPVTVIYEGTKCEFSELSRTGEFTFRRLLDPSRKHFMYRACSPL